MNLQRKKTISVKISHKSLFLSKPQPDIYEFRIKIDFFT